MRASRMMMLVLGTPLALLGLGFVAAAAGAGWLHFQQRDDGFFTSPTERFETSSNAITSLGLEIIVGRRLPDFLPSDTAGSILLRGAPVTTGKDIFLGVAPQQEVSRYLDGVRRSEITELDLRPFRVEYRDIPGTRTPARPGAQTFWTATATGPGSQELRWDLQPGNWAIVVMNADGSAPLAADLQGRIRSDLLWPLFLVLLLAGIVLLAIGVPLIIAAARAMGPPPHRPPTPGPPAAVPGASGSPYYTGTAGGSAAGSPAGGGAGSPPPPSAVGIFSNAPYPARLDGYLDPALSRWMWLVKWFLALPHLIVLFFLWFALIVTSIVAWFAILFTARYPPFTLARTDYPADFDVDYPERLSRGLVLVKSWLLAIPHLLIVGVLAGTTRTWAASDDGWSGYGARYAAGGMISLIALLVLIAGVILLFTGRFLPSLFDLLLGLNRWVYRVTAYVALMRDEYPPFRLDMGLADPRGTQPANSIEGPPANPMGTGRTNQPKGQS